MYSSTTLKQRKSATRGLNLLAAAGIFAVLLAAAIALTFASTNAQAGSTSATAKTALHG